MLDAPLCRFAFAGGLVGLVALAVTYAATGDWIGVDLDVYRAGGAAILHGHGLYGATFTGPSDLKFTYPPFAAVLFTPLVMAGHSVALALWNLAMILAAGFLVVVSIKAAFHAPVPRRWLPHVVVGGGLVATLLSPVDGCMYYGQVGVFLVLACVFDVTSPNARGHGALVGLAAALKMVPGLFIVYFAVIRDWKALRNSLATTAICWGFTAAALPRDSFAYFIKGLGFDPTRAGDLDYHLNESLDALWNRSAVPAPAVWWLVSSALAVVLGLWRAKRAHERHDSLAAAVLVGTASVLASPISWLHHCCWVVPALIVLIGHARRRIGSFLGLVLVGALFLAPKELFIGTDAHATGLLVNVYTVALIGILALLPAGRRLSAPRQVVPAQRVDDALLSPVPV